ncbi:hypothetical protein AYI70_g2451 [Smittium culicis]|uniref:Uncharacterized protein n=1 Tax=Smittium culicis TaxID=133412 RepID=A0A1R1Y853_9FUNG|nr:hypothetical protein AYI70_g6121 [Smittium culicis]OMJ23131.1 hypothetical protein AYI70_g2451 [Smittium culicis]
MLDTKNKSRNSFSKYQIGEIGISNSDYSAEDNISTKLNSESPNFFANFSPSSLSSANSIRNGNPERNASLPYINSNTLQEKILKNLGVENPKDYKHYEKSFTSSTILSDTFIDVEQIKRNQYSPDKEKQLNYKIQARKVAKLSRNIKPRKAKSAKKFKKENDDFPRTMKAPHKNKDSIKRRMKKCENDNINYQVNRVFKKDRLDFSSAFDRYKNEKNKIECDYIKNPDPNRGIMFLNPSSIFNFSRSSMESQFQRDLAFPGKANIANRYNQSSISPQSNGASALLSYAFSLKALIVSTISVFTLAACLNVTSVFFTHNEHSSKKQCRNNASLVAIIWFFSTTVFLFVSYFISSKGDMFVSRTMRYIQLILLVLTVVVLSIGLLTSLKIKNKLGNPGSLIEQSNRFGEEEKLFNYSNREVSPVSPVAPTLARHNSNGTHIENNSRFLIRLRNQGSPSSADSRTLSNSSGAGKISPLAQISAYAVLLFVALVSADSFSSLPSIARSVFGDESSLVDFGLCFSLVALIIISFSPSQISILSYKTFIGKPATIVVSAIFFLISSTLFSKLAWN